jgi:hypothetical protein
MTAFAAFVQRCWTILFTHIASVADLAGFMEDRVFAVWDLMSL